MQTTDATYSPHVLAYDVLVFALTHKRPHAGRGVQKLVKFLSAKFPTARADGFGNLHIDTRKDATNRTLFVAHLDTVHRQDGKNRIEHKDGLLRAVGDLLGADDGAGVALLAHLITSNIPAYYIFTQGEECGGLGAKHLARHHSALLSDFDRAIAFDRRGTSDVITHQGMSRCCSDSFAESLSDALNAQGMLYMPDPTGSYTDTAEFTVLIPECTNISCGYSNEHRDSERLSLAHFRGLLSAVTAVAWDSLPTARNPADVFDSGSSPWGDFAEDWSSDPAKCELIEAVDRALMLDDSRQLKTLMVSLIPLQNRALALRELRSVEIPEDILEMVYHGIEDADVEDLLFWLLEMTAPSLL
jgi:Peptidase family M28